MTLVEIATRAVCKDIGIDPDQWHGFANIGIVAMTAVLEAVGPEIRAALESLAFPDPQEIEAGLEAVARMMDVDDC